MLAPGVPCGMTTARAMGSFIHNLPHLYVHTAQPAPMPISQETTLMLATAETVATAWYATTPTATVAILLYTRIIPARALVISTMGMTVISTLMPVNWFATTSIIQALRGLADVRVSTVATTARTSTTTRISERSTWIPAQT